MSERTIVADKRRLSGSVHFVMGKHSGSRVWIVLIATLIVTATALARSFYEGRLASPLTHNDVNYFIEAVKDSQILWNQGFWAFIRYIESTSLHAPLHAVQGALSFIIFGINDWAPYATNIIYVGLFFGLCLRLLRGFPNVVVIAAMLALIGMPLTATTVTEFAPEAVCSLMIVVGAVFLLRISLLDAPLRARLFATAWFGLALLAHPVAFPFTFVAAAASIGLVFLREVLLAGRYRDIGRGITYSALNLVLTLWLAAFYVVPRWWEYWYYFHLALFDKENLAYFGTMPGFWDNLKFYTAGGGSYFLCGTLFPVYVGVILISCVVAWWRGERSFVRQQAEYAVLTFIFWLLPTLSAAKSASFAASFGFMVGVMLVLALGSIYQALGTVSRTAGAVSILVLGFILLVSGQGPKLVGNTFSNPLNREEAWEAIDRLVAVMTGNAPDPDHNLVYLTNNGALANPILQYYVLKKHPNSDWVFDTGANLKTAKQQIDRIDQTIPDFVIAGEQDNGFTYETFAAPGENETLAMIQRDPEYMAIDRFYGPLGRAVTVFERIGPFAGWRPISGIDKTTSADLRRSEGAVSYLQTYAARPVTAEMLISASGTKGQQINVFVNQVKLGSLILDGEEYQSSLRLNIQVTGGLNDIILQYSSDGPVSFNRLLIVPHLPGGTTQLAVTDTVAGIMIRSATYGGNCGASAGNATKHVTKACDGKLDCDYVMSIEAVGGDPAGGCPKDFAVSYTCTGLPQIKQQHLPGEANGRHAHLSCSPATLPAAR